MKASCRLMYAGPDRQSRISRGSREFNTVLLSSISSHRPRATKLLEEQKAGISFSHIVMPTLPGLRALRGIFGEAISSISLGKRGRERRSILRVD